jgi:hypothetical protein
LENRHFERTTQNKIMRNQYLSNQDIFSVGPVIHRRTCPGQADVKLRFSGSPRFCEDFLCVRRDAAAHDVVTRRVQQGRLQKRSVLDLLQIFGKLGFSTVIVDVYSAARILVQNPNHPTRSKGL